MVHATAALTGLGWLLAGASLHVVLTESAMFHYKQTTTYDRSSQFTLLWNDPELKIWWPIHNPIISQRDGGTSA